jgi:hypothetical protein
VHIFVLIGGVRKILLLCQNSAFLLLKGPTEKFLIKAIYVSRVCHIMYHALASMEVLEKPIYALAPCIFV